MSETRKTVLPTVGPHGMSTVDPGNIMDRGDREYYVSETKVLPPETEVMTVCWQGQCTSTSWVEIEVRAAKDQSFLEQAPWVAVEPGADLRGMNLTGVIQYRLALCAKCGCGTPRITEVVVEYSEI